jgi:hypothetical protein
VFTHDVFIEPLTPVAFVVALAEMHEALQYAFFPATQPESHDAGTAA